MNEQIKILIVDNDQDFIRVHSKNLIQSGYQVASAASGKEAFENLASFFPDIVLLGIRLSDMSGFDILSTIRSVNKDRSIFVIMVTEPGSPMKPPAQGLGAGADDYLEKPVTPGMLNARINTTVRIQKAEHELRLTKSSLERLIQKQTSELKLTNAYLREEIKNLENTLKSLRLSGRRHREIFHQAPVGGAVLGLDGKFQQVNQELRRMTGYTEEELLCLSVDEITHPDDLPATQANIQALLSDRIDFSEQEKRYIRKDRSSFWGKTTGRIIHNREGSRYLLALIVDIDKQKKVQATLEKNHDTLEQKISERTAQLQSVNCELRDEIQVRKIAQEDILRKEKHLKTSQKVAVLGSFFSSPDGSDMDFSDGFYDLFGYASGEAVLGYDLIKHHIFSNDKHRFEQDMESIYKTQGPIDAEYRIVLKNATIREIRLIATPVFNEDAIPVEIRGIFQDITERKQMERQMIQNEKLASLGFLASGVAHEINNPNNFISFNIPILREYLGAILPIVDAHAEGKTDFELCNMGYDAFKKDVIKLADNIENGSSRINKIVSNLRKFVYMKESVENSRVNVQKVIQTCVDMAEAKVNNLVKHFEIDMADNLPEIETDSEILNIAVINLLINAAQACDKENSRVRLSVAYDNRLKGSMVITVSDNGSGMDPETISRAFDPFFSTKPSGEGTGIGLSLVHNLVTSLGGQISVESEPGLGSTFTLRIPDLRKKA